MTNPAQEKKTNFQSFQHWEYREARRKLDKPYAGDFVDPTASQIVKPFEALASARMNTYGLVAPATVEDHYILDIETWRLNEKRLHNGYICSMRHPEKFGMFFRAWNEENNNETRTIPVDQRLKAILYFLVSTSEAKKIRVWAHNGAGFDFKWLKYAVPLGHYDDDGKPAVLMLNKPFVEEWAEDDGEDPSLRHEYKASWEIRLLGNRQTVKLKMTKKTTAATSSRKNAKRKQSADHPRKQWSCEFVDSAYHLTGKLKDFGSKGITPIQYTRPTVWLESMGRLPDDYDFWFDHVDQQALDYNRQDCEILAKALTDYEQNAWSFFPDLKRLGISPLDYLTAPKYAMTGAITVTYRKRLPGGLSPLKKHNLEKAGMARHASAAVAGLMEHRIREEGDYLVREKGSREWVRASRIPSPDKETGELPVKLPFPVAQGQQAAYTESGWFCYAPALKLFHAGQAGGRCEVFAPMNRPNTNVYCFDFSSHYPSVQALRRYTDVRMMQPMDSDIEGREAILKYLENHGGLFYIETTPSLSPLVRKFPVLWTRVAGANPEERLIFPNWQGTAYFYATAPELKLFLEMGDVEGGKIRIIADRSIAGKLLPLSEGPFYAFATRLYSFRQKAKNAKKRLVKELDSLSSNHDLPEEEILALTAQLESDIAKETGKDSTSKILLNAGGFGTMLQSNSNPIYLQDNDWEGHIKLMSDFAMLYDPFWSGWVEYNDALTAEFPDPTKTPAHFAQSFFASQYLTCWKYYADKESNVATICYNLPGSLASHAIRPWGAECTAHARADLLRNIYKFYTAAVPGGVQICYCDTDSIYAAIDEKIPVETLIEAVEKNGVKIGNDMGCMDYEEKPADKFLMVPGVDVDSKGNIRNASAVFLGPKNYHLYDKKTGHILKSVMKGIPKTIPTMRSCLLGFQIRSAKLAERCDLPPEIPTLRDALVSLQNGTFKTKRSFHSPYDSEALTFTPPRSIDPTTGEILPFEGTWMEALQYFGDIRGEIHGLQIALETWKTLKVPSAKGKSRTVMEERDILRRAFNDIQSRMYRAQIAAEEGDEYAPVFDTASILDRLDELYDVRAEYTALGLEDSTTPQAMTESLEPEHPFEEEK